MSLKARIKNLFTSSGAEAVHSRKTNHDSASESEVRGTSKRFEFKQDIDTLSFFKTSARGNTPRVLLLTSEKRGHLERVCRCMGTLYRPASGFFVIHPPSSDSNLLLLSMNDTEHPTLAFDMSSQHQTLIELLRYLEIELVHVRFTQDGPYQLLSLLKALQLPFNLEVRESVIEQLAEDSETMNDYKWLSNNCKQLSVADSK